jgi:hypothetical protein
LLQARPAPKFKIFLDAVRDRQSHRQPVHVERQYRGGSDGNPDNSISFKALYGSFADNRKFEPSSAK